MKFNIKRNPFLIKLFNWEYWPFDLLYTPVFFVYCWLALRVRSFFFFSTSNPTIKNAGFLMESKYAIDSIIPLEYRPPSIYCEPKEDFNRILNKITTQQFLYPLIIKPDIGGKGVGVMKVNSESELKKASGNFPTPFIIQPFISFPNEIGLFYVKFPGETKGNITGIVRKEFLKVTGDGKHTILELLWQNNRHILQIPTLKKILGNDLNSILPANSCEILVPYGNHARGCLFLDDSHLISPRLEATFNNVCSQIEGFYYGRMDIKYNSWEELQNGKNFSIIELNGAGSEPTHIYDPRHSVFFAWREISRHLKLLWQVSKRSKEHFNLHYMSYREGMQMFADKRAYEKIWKSKGTTRG